MHSLDDVRSYAASKHRPEGLIVDTNILILFLVGSYDSNLIEHFKALQESGKDYSSDDFELLKEILDDEGN